MSKYDRMVELNRERSNRRSQPPVKQSASWWNGRIKCQSLSWWRWQGFPENLLQEPHCPQACRQGSITASWDGRSPPENTGHGNGQLDWIITAAGGRLKEGEWYPEKREPEAEKGVE